MADLRTKKGQARAEFNPSRVREGQTLEQEL